MRSTVRLPPELGAEARQRCERLGITFNALVCVALDAFLRSPEPSPEPPAPEPPVPAAPAAGLTGRERYELEHAHRKAARRRR